MDNWRADTFLVPDNGLLTHNGWRTAAGSELLGTDYVYQVMPGYPAEMADLGMRNTIEGVADPDGTFHSISAVYVRPDVSDQVALDMWDSIMFLFGPFDRLIDALELTEADTEAVRSWLPAPTDIDGKDTSMSAGGFRFRFVDTGAEGFRLIIRADPGR